MKFGTVYLQFSRILFPVLLTSMNIIRGVVVKIPESFDIRGLREAPGYRKGYSTPPLRSTAVDLRECLNLKTPLECLNLKTPLKNPPPSSRSCGRD